MKVTTLKARDIQKNKFWYCVSTEEKKKLIIDELLFCEFLYNNGFRRFTLSKGNHLFVRIYENKIIEPIDIVMMQDFVFDWIESLPIDTIDDLKDPRKLTRKILAGISYYFKKEMLRWLRSKEEIIFNQDTLKEKFIYYKNGFISITKKNVEIKPYSELFGYIWRDQVLDRTYNINQEIKGRNVMGDFINLIAGETTKRTLDLKIALGYYMHDFYDYKLKCLLLTDSKLSDHNDDANGRTGKSLISKLLGYIVSSDPSNPDIKTYVEINGKDFDPKEKFKFESCSLETKLVVINDLQRGFDVENLFNAIVDGIMVNQKFMAAFRIRTKIMANSNKSVRVEKDSAKDRFIEFELSDHFSAKHSPEDEFGHWFIRDWDRRAFNDFDTVMIDCAQLFLKNGANLNIPKQINLNARKLRDNTSADFLEFMAEIWKPYTNTDYKKKEWISNFIQAYPDWIKISNRRFTKWFQLFCDFTPGVEPYRKATHERREKYDSYYIFQGETEAKVKILS